MKNAGKWHARTTWQPENSLTENGSFAATIIPAKYISDLQRVLNVLLGNIFTSQVETRLPVTDLAGVSRRAFLPPAEVEADCCAHAFLVGFRIAEIAFARGA